MKEEISDREMKKLESMLDKLESKMEVKIAEFERRLARMEVK